MKKLLLILVMLNLVQHLILAQEPQWEWAKYGLHTGYTEGLAACVDSRGNTFLSGFFLGNTLEFGNTNLVNSDNTNSTFDIFLVKYDASGTLLWAKSAAGPSADDWCYDITCDTVGNVILTGFFRGSSITFGNITLTNPGLFVVKFDGSGNVIWAKDAIGNSETRSVVTDLSGNVLITGWYNTATLKLGNITLTNGGFVGIKDFFVAKYDALGNVVWAKSSGGIGPDQGLSIGTDSIGNVYVTGDFKSPSITFGNTNLANANSDSTDIFLVKYDTDGNGIWAKREGGSSSDGGFGISTTLDGNSYVTGWFYSSIVQYGNSTLNRVGPWGNKDMFLAKYDSAGNVIWAKSAGSVYDVNSWGIITNSVGNVLIAGGYSGQVSFGNITLTSSGGIDPAFVVMYNSDGEDICAFKLSSGGDDILDIAIDRNGNTYLGGDWTGASGIADLPVVGFENAFVAKFRFDCEVVTSNFDTKENCIIIYPNPASSILTLSPELQIKNGNLKIMDATGQGVIQLTVKSHPLSIDVSCLDPGFYYLTLESEKGTEVKKFEVIR